MAISCEECTADVTYAISQDGITWTPLPEPASGSRLFTSDGQLMAWALASNDNPTQLTTWKWAGGKWQAVDTGAFDQNGCGSIDNRDGPYLFATDDKTIADLDSVNWQPTDNGWICAAGPHIGIAAGHGAFIGIGESALNASDESFWRSDDGLRWEKTQDAPQSMRVVAVKAGFVAVGSDAPRGPVDYLFTSADGNKWNPSPIPFGDVYLEWLASDGNRAVMIEDSDNPGTKAPGAIWVSSPDGSDWTRYQLPPRKGDYATFAAIWGNRLVVSGTSYNGGNSIGDGLVWSADIP